jgi:hypothetical protein
MSNNYSLRRHTRTLKLQNLPNEILIIVEVSVVLFISTALEKGNERGTDYDPLNIHIGHTD